MPDPSVEWSEDAAEILTEIGKDVTVKNVPGGTPVALKCLMTQPAVMQDLETGGFLNQTSFDVKFLRSQAQANPGLIAFGNVIAFQGEEYRIMTVTNRPPSAWIIVKVQTKVQ
jgi:hypothetical protein